MEQGKQARGSELKKYSEWSRDTGLAEWIRDFLHGISLIT
jgi:hypothetical protein